MLTIRKGLGFVGALTCVVAFALAFVGSLFISISFAQVAHDRCGTPAASLQVSAFVYGAVLSGIVISGSFLASRGGFCSPWWRLFRNLAVGLCAFTNLFTLLFQ